MAVEVRIPTVFRKFTEGQSVVELEPGTIGDLISQLEARYPGLGGQLLTEAGELHRFVNVYVNDEDSRYLDKLDTKVVEGDTVSLLPSVAGGSDLYLR
ncbi:MAG TPA: MoaD family protein [Actinomycetota bacterium]|nr:MoaD family protein [Actinomycetota bacterium]